MNAISAQKFEVRIEGLYVADDSGFRSRPVERLELGFDGVAGDRHGGATQTSGSHEPWHERGTEIRNDRQVSILSVEELAIIADRLGIERLEAEWIVGNILVSGLAGLSSLPPRSVIAFAGGAAVKIDGDNAPCRFAGKSIGEMVGREDIQFEFPKLGVGLRGLVGWVESPGSITVGETASVRVPNQPAWPPAAVSAMSEA